MQTLYHTPEPILSETRAVALIPAVEAARTPHAENDNSAASRPTLLEQRRRRANRLSARWS